MKTRSIRNAALMGLLAVSLALPALAQDAGQLDKETAVALPTKPPYSPYAVRNFPTRPLFGDTHLHTALSMDAGLVGCRLGPREAYRFAKGEEVVSSTGQPAKLIRVIGRWATDSATSNQSTVSQRNENPDSTGANRANGKTESAPLPPFAPVKSEKSKP